MSIDVFVRTLHLPGSIKGFSRRNPDGTVTVIINEDLDLETQYEVVEHELEHIANEDCDSDKSADSIEAIRHAI